MAGGKRLRGGDGPLFLLKFVGKPGLYHQLGNVPIWSSSSSRSETKSSNLIPRYEISGSHVTASFGMASGS